MADDGKKDEFDISVVNSIYPHAASVFTHHKSLEEIRDDCFIVLDNNVLLTLYTTGEADLLDQCRKIYTQLQKRLIIPGQVAREFAKHRTAKLAELHMQMAKKQIPSIQKGKFPLLSSLSEYKKLMDLEEEIDRKLREYQKDYEQAVKSVLAHIEGWRWNDPVSLLYADLFSEETVIDPPIDEEEIQKDLHRRELYKNLPGYKEGWKEDKGIGDLLIWRTILEIGRTHKKSVIFVSGDGKPDWCQQSMGQPLYPRYELVYDFLSVSEGQSFHLIKFSKFLKLYGASDKVIDEVRQEEKLLTLGTNARASFTIAHELAHAGYQSTYAVLMWLKRIDTHSRIVEGGNDLDFIKISTKGMQTGYIVKFSEFPVVGEEVSNLYSALETVYDGQKLNELMIFVVYPNSSLANSELVRLDKKLLPLPKGISIVIGLVDTNNNLQVVGALPRYILAG